MYLYNKNILNLEYAQIVVTHANSRILDIEGHSINYDSTIVFTKYEGNDIQSLFFAVFSIFLKVTYKLFWNPDAVVEFSAYSRTYFNQRLSKYISYTSVVFVWFQTMTCYAYAMKTYTVYNIKI